MNKTTYQLIGYLILVLLLQACTKRPLAELSIIPQPAAIERHDGVYSIEETVHFKIDTKDDQTGLETELINYFTYYLQLKAKKVTSDKKADMRLILSNDKSLKDTESYKLSVSEEGLTVSAASESGLFYGIQTMKQLLMNQESTTELLIPYLEIHDSPRFHWRGLMLDVSRHFFDKQAVMKVIDLMAIYKLNTFHWHLVDGIGWRLPIDRYPELTDKGAWRKIKSGKDPWEDFEAVYNDGSIDIYGGHYSKEDIREIIAYANTKHITIVPEIEMPGHSEAALQCFPQLLCDPENNTGVYCAGNEDTFSFLENIIDEVALLFPGEYIHIGGDEVGKDAWLSCAKCRKRMSSLNINNADSLQSYFVKRIEKHIAKHGKRLIGWDEILEGGLPPTATVMSWRGIHGGIEAANEGHDVVMTPGSPFYFDHSQGKSELEPPSWGGHNSLLKVYSFDPVPGEIAADKTHHILGGQANLWTERIATQDHLEYMLLPRLLALSETLWTPLTQKDSINFVNKLDGHLNMLSSLNYNFAGSSMTPDYKVFYDKEKDIFELELFNEIDRYQIRYTLDGVEPGISSNLYSGPIEFNEAIQIKAQCFRNDQPIGYPLIKTFSTGFGAYSSVKYLNPYHETYSGGGDKALINNQYATPRGDDPNWQGFESNDFDITIDLGKARELSSIKVNFFQHIGATSVMLPTEVVMEISEDGKDFRKVLEETIETSQDRSPMVKTVTAEFETHTLTYIRIKAKNRSTLPDWHIRKGSAWIFVDEITVE